MNIVVLDGYAINPGDIDWKLIEKLGDVTVYDRTSPELTLQRCVDADIVLTNKTKIGKEIIENLPDLKYIGELATGYDNIAIDAAANREIPVCNVPGYSTDSVAQHTFALILELASGVGARSEDVKNGGWVKSEDFCYGHRGLIELKGKKLGLVGLGKIGSAVAKIGHAFGMEILASVRHPEHYIIPFVEMVSLRELAKQSDFVSLHCPLTEETREMVDEDFLAFMNMNGYLINTARGGLINEEDLAYSLNNDLIAGAALDVLSSEPPKKDNPLLHAQNCFITPHVAWATREARLRLLDIAADNIRGFLNGRLIHVVNGVKD